jgi:hypothetical protein
MPVRQMRYPTAATAANVCFLILLNTSVLAVVSLFKVQPESFPFN